MVEISLQQISKYYGARQIFEQVSFEVMTGDRIGLVGTNGCGKSTLLGIVMDREDYQAGQVQIRKGARIRCLEQFMEYGETDTVQMVCAAAFQDVWLLKAELGRLEQAMADSDQLGPAGQDKLIRRYGRVSEQFEQLQGYAIETRMEMIMQGLAISSALRQMTFARLSGGEKTRVALARLLMEDPDVLLLDEPSNHLDITSIEWLESFLASFKGTVLMVSHDRIFLDHTVNRIIELKATGADCYKGNFSSYVVEKEQRFLTAMHAYENQQKKIERMEQQIERYRIWAAMRDSEVMERAAKVMERKLERVERLDKPRIDEPKVRLRADASHRSGREVLAIKDLGISFGHRHLFKGVELLLEYQDRACLLGHNGCGKTTFLKLILGELTPGQGRIQIGASLSIGYLPQDVLFPNAEQTVLDYFARTHDLSQSEARHELAKALFRKDDVLKKIGNLSGGEKSRLRLCSLCYEKVNFLIMDEPTNHLDIESREVLESTLQHFEGTILFVSHDRYFINQVADRILVLEDGCLQDYPMSYDEYRETIKRTMNAKAAATGAAKVSARVKKITGSMNFRSA